MSMFEFINLLRALAAALITNSHYGEIWPVTALATGGLLGNVIFFAVSGFCLAEVKGSFFKWYGRRVLRVLPVMVLFTIFTVLIGVYPINSTEDFVRTFIFPTNYVFLVWLLVLYAVHYAVAWIEQRWGKRFLVMGVVLIAWLAVYAFVVDKSAYVVDEVHRPFILFVYFFAMQIGTILRRDAEKSTRFKPLNLILIFVTAAAYFVIKVLLGKNSALYGVQIISQLVLLVLLYVTFVTLISIERRLKSAPVAFRRCIGFVSKITLHVYLVQFVIIAWFKGLVFPLNALVVTALILVAAWLLKTIEDVVRKAIVGALCKGEKFDGKAQN